jgi:hypothetical protein
MPAAPTGPALKEEAERIAREDLKKSRPNARDLRLMSALQRGEVWSLMFRYSTEGRSESAQYAIHSDRRTVEGVVFA